MTLFTPPFLTRRTALTGIALAAFFPLARADVPVVGTPAPVFTLPDQHAKPRALAQWRGKWVVLYFYPKDDTPGCTEQACAFRDDLNQLTALDAQVVGISVWTPAIRTRRLLRSTSCRSRCWPIPRARWRRAMVRCRTGWG